MSARSILRCSFFLLLLIASSASAQESLRTAFSYQGQLELDGSLISGEVDMQFTLYDAAVGGSVIGLPVIFDSTANGGVTAVSGNFTVTLDFGAAALNGDRRWLHISVRYPAGTGGYVGLAPRQELTGAPYALQTRGLFVDDQLRVGIGTRTPSWPLDILGTQGVIRLTSTISNNGSVLELKNSAVSPTYLGAINFNDAGSTFPGQITYDVASPSTHTLRFRIQGLSPAFYTRFGLNLVTGGQYRDNASLRALNINPDAGMAAYLANNSTWATAHVQNNGTGEVLWLQHEGTGNYIVASSGSDWKFWVDNAGVTHTKVLRILGGSDLSEKFDVSVADLALEAGMTVSIDPVVEGRLQVSREAYDHRVAGIVSGAGGVNPGMIMGQEGSVADGEHPVALTGRVYCWVDADHGPVQPGDLLTTSITPGHAMRVEDFSRAQGAIIGKSMGRLEEGRGLVLVLVGLQ